MLEDNEIKIENVKIVSTDKSKVNAVGGDFENYKICAPFGYFYSPTKNEKAKTLKFRSENLILGTENNDSSLENGEIKIKAKTGAYIYLKNDGSVVINGLKIDKNGVIE